jgi:hypothetical protein
LDGLPPAGPAAGAVSGVGFVGVEAQAASAHKANSIGTQAERVNIEIPAGLAPLHSLRHQVG